MAKSKSNNEKNSLEQFLIRINAWFAENKTKTYQFLLVFVLVLAAIWVVRANLGGGSQKLNAADAAYANAMQNYFISAAPAPDAKLLQEAANVYKSGKIGAELQTEAGEAFLQAGLADVQRKTANSRAAKNDPEAAALDPNANFTSATTAFKAAVALGEAELSARAYYGAGVAQEGIASVAADAAQVDAALAEAKNNYQQVAAVCADSPYCKPAAQRLAALENALTTEYYKNVADKFNKLPVPKETPSILSGDSELKPGETPDVAGFELNDDEAPATQEAAPAEEENVEAPATQEAAPAEEAPKAE